MTTMALHVLMAPDGIHPERIEACGWGIDGRYLPQQGLDQFQGV